jgi:hypothetical protein
MTRRIIRPSTLPPARMASSASPAASAGMPPSAALEPLAMQGSGFDPADFALRCLDTPATAPTALAPPCDGTGLGLQRVQPAPPMPRQGPDAGGDRFSELLTRAHYRMFPPHLYPPLKAEPQVIRATRIAAAPVGTTRTALLTWVCPPGRAFTAQEAHLRAATGGVAAEVGFLVTRNDQVLFDGTEHTIRNVDESLTTLPVLLPIAAAEPVAFISLPWNTTVLAGERLVVAFVTKTAAALNLTAQVQVRGYTYPMELIP